MKKILLFVVICAMLSSCSYSVFLNTLPHLRNVQISPFENNTHEYALAQDFQNYLVNSFQSDGRLKITTIEPDSFIEGIVLDYRHEIISYDNFGNILEYRVTILFDIKMTDLRMQEVIYENRNLVMSENYSINPDNPDVLSTEAQAQEKVFEKVFDTIIRSTLEAW